MPSKKVSCLTATNLVVANMIGTGVFTSLGFQVASIRSDTALIALWAIGGIVSLCGALCYAELAATLRRSGGEYRFLASIYHPSIGMIAGWISATVGFAAPIALAAMAFGSYLQAVVPGVPPVALSLLLVWIVTAVHLAGVRTGATFQNSSTLIKLVLILVLIIAGLLIWPGQPLHFSATPEDVRELLSGPFAVSLVYVMYAYSGWNAAAYITEEVVEPEKNVPRALAVGTVIVTVIYLVLNYVFLHTTPKATLAGQLQVGMLAGQAIFGPWGARIVSILIGFGLVATVGAMGWIGPRVTKAIADDLPRLQWLQRSTRNGTPIAATLLQLAIVTALILSATFETVLVYIQFTLLLSSFLTVLGLIVLRIRRPELPRPYRVWGYPITPLVFLAATLHMIVYTVREKPLESLCGTLTACFGLVVYFVCRAPGGKPDPVPLAGAEFRRDAKPDRT
ncbi:MAG: amino acid permease [Verrucomicrobia bacterium]|nr:amino acid permease [Verrucomicrobiota bacterium]